MIGGQVIERDKINIKFVSDNSPKMTTENNKFLVCWWDRWATCKCSVDVYYFIRKISFLNPRKQIGEKMKLMTEVLTFWETFSIKKNEKLKNYSN